MSEAQELEIQRLHRLLHTAQSERNEAVARAEELHVKLLEVKLKAKHAVEHCKRDAVEVATEEAVREHFYAMNDMDLMMKRNVAQVSEEKALLLRIKGSLVDLRELSNLYSESVARAALAQSPVELDGTESVESDGHGIGDGVADTALAAEVATRNAVCAEAYAAEAAAASQLVRNVCSVMMSPEMAYFFRVEGGEEVGDAAFDEVSNAGTVIKGTKSHAPVKAPSSSSPSEPTRRELNKDSALKS
mmetsp:Transcript_78769/g.157459  ORF Transcript_78769/g.157459 Transcript_78769/m.157459 type:complete len:246 (+) Transcript_78769:82-819(+)